MKYQDRPYDDAAGDFRRLWDFFVQDYADRNGEFVWTVGRMVDWRYNLGTPRKYSPLFLAKSAQLWFDDLGALVALAINEDLRHTIAVFTKKGYGHLFGVVVDWCVEHWVSYAQPWSEERDAPDDDPIAPCRRFVLNLAESDHRTADTLAARGWRDLGREETTRRFDVATKAAAPIDVPEGFRVVSMVEDPNFASKRRLHHNAWSHDAPVTELELDLFEYVRTAPTYDPALDISAVAPDGEHVAGCTAFPDFVNSYAEIERVCTHSAYRRRGLAAATIFGCFRALHAAGLRHAYLTGNSEAGISLYGKLGHVGEWHTHAWQLVVPGPSADPAPSR